MPSIAFLILINGFCQRDEPSLIKNQKRLQILDLGLMKSI
jgi:hypothetical protein